MSRKLAFFEDLFYAIDSWSNNASEAITDINDDLIWIENKSNVSRIQAVLRENNIGKEEMNLFFLECFNGLSHSFLCILDGATKLSAEGRVYLVDEDGNKLGEGLHEEFFGYIYDQKLLDGNKR